MTICCNSMLLKTRSFKKLKQMKQFPITYSLRMDTPNMDRQLKRRIMPKPTAKSTMTCLTLKKLRIPKTVKRLKTQTRLQKTKINLKILQTKMKSKMKIKKRTEMQKKETESIEIKQIRYFKNSHTIHCYKSCKQFAH